MKKLSQPSSEKFSLVRLYLEDFYSIVEVLQDQRGSMKIVADGFLIEDPREIETLNQPVVRNLEIQTSNPAIRIALSSDSSEVSVSEDDAKAVGLFSKLTEILSRSQSSWKFVEQGWLATIFGFAWLGSLSLVSFGIREFEFSVWLSGAVLTALGWGAAFVLRRRQFFLFLQRESTKQSFVKRRKDDVLLAIISAIVGSGLTLLGTWLLGRFK